MRHDRARDAEWPHPTFLVQRVGTAVIGVGIWLLGVLMFAGHTGFTGRQGAVVLGLAGNGLLASASLVVGATLFVAAIRGGIPASTTAATVGVLFVVGGLLGLAVVHTGLNFLAYNVPDVFFSLVVGMVLLFIGLHGRVSGQLLADGPYPRRPGTGDIDRDAAPRWLAETEELAVAEHAMAEGEAGAEQREKVVADARDHAARRRVSAAWRRGRGPAAGGDPA